MKEIKYIGFYDVPNAIHKRACALAATNKMDYICKAISKAGYKVHLISPSWFMDVANAKFQRATTLQLNENKKLTLSPSFSTSKRITGYLKILLSLTWLFFWLILNVKKNEKIVVYHSPWLALPLLWAKKIKGFKIVLEVEEIYNKVWVINNKLKKWEDNLIKYSDSYIVVSDILYNLLPNRDKIVLYGSYSFQEKRTKIVDKNKINVLYAGSIDKTKGGAFNLVECVKYLPENYYVHILGYGSEELILELEELINKVNNTLNRKSCIYQGVKIGKEYSEFLYKCNIGVNPQEEGGYMNTAFPSKILSYLSHNLPVVSTRIESILKSKLGEHIVFSENDIPEEIAKAIKLINIEYEYDFNKVIKDLDDEFILELKKTLIE